MIVLKRICKGRYPEDVTRIHRVLEEAGFKASRRQCEELWDRYSDSVCAGWMMLLGDDAEILANIEPFFVVED